MKTIKQTFLIILALGISACGGIKPIDPEILANADYGSYPTNYEDAVKSYFEVRLKDPFSAQYRFNKPYTGYLRAAPILGGKPTAFGYLVDVTINAKNSYGAYIGWREYQLFLRDGKVVQEVMSNPWFEE